MNSKLLRRLTKTYMGMLRFLHPSRPSFSYLSPFSTRTALVASLPFLSGSLTHPLPCLTNSFPRLPLSLAQLLGPFLLAAPKKKTSHSKKRMRSANKQLKDKSNFTMCPICGQLKMLHHLCLNCYQDFRKQLRLDRKEAIQEIGTDSE